MEKPISVGDLVQVVRPSFCKGGNDGLGYTFIVQGMERGGGGSCTYCRKDHDGHLMFACCGEYWWPLDRLKRIPPLNELDDVKRDETVSA